MIINPIRLWRRHQFRKRRKLTPAQIEVIDRILDKTSYNRYIALGREVDRPGYERHKARHPELSRRGIVDPDTGDITWTPGSIDGS